MLSVLFAAIVVTSSWSPVGAHSTVKCRADFKCAENSLNQSPCVMASCLLSKCQRNDYLVRPLAEGAHYNGPSRRSESTECWCSSVTYSLFAACEACQGHSASELPTWDEWIANCAPADISNGSYPRDIPKGTEVPPWAYREYGSGQRFVPEALQGSGNGGTEVCPASSSTGSTSEGVSSTMSGSPSPTSDTNPSSTPTGITPPSEGATTDTPTGNGNRTGKIIGGTIGGGIGQVTILLLAFCWYRRKDKQEKDKEAAHDDEKLPEEEGATGHVPPALTSTGSQPPLPPTRIDGGETGPTAGPSGTGGDNYGTSPQAQDSSSNNQAPQSGQKDSSPNRPFRFPLPFGPKRATQKPGKQTTQTKPNDPNDPFADPPKPTSAVSADPGAGVNTDPKPPATNNNQKQSSLPPTLTPINNNAGNAPDVNTKPTATNPTNTSTGNPTNNQTQGPQPPGVINPQELSNPRLLPRTRQL